MSSFLCVLCAFVVKGLLREQPAALLLQGDLLHPQAQCRQPHGQLALQDAIDAALVLGCTDEAAVRHLVTARSLEHARPAMVEVGLLAQFERPLPTVGEYDQLLAPVPTAAAR